MSARAHLLPSQYLWRRWRSSSVKFWRPGDPHPDSEIWDLTLDGTGIARIHALGNGQWLVSVFTWTRPIDHQHAVAADERQARRWCEGWVLKRQEDLRARFPLAFEHPNGMSKEIGTG